MTARERAPAIVDVARLCESLPHAHGKVVKAARKWRWAHSFSADLLMAHDYLVDAIRWHRTHRQALERATTALLHSAVLTYVRPFDPASRHRGELKIGSKLSANESEFHAQLIHLRHESLAHYGPAGTEKAWSEDRIFLVCDSETWLPVVTARRSQFDFAFATKFLSHVKSIQIIVNKNVEETRADFQNRLQLAWAESPEIDEIIRSSELDARALGGWDGPILSGTWSGRLVMELPDTMFTD